MGIKDQEERKSYHHGDLKAALRTASLEILKTEGYKGLSLRKVARHAGVSEAAPYRHYSNIESLFADLASEGFSRLTEKLRRVQGRYRRHALLQFRESAVAYVDFALKNSDLFKMMYGNDIADHSAYPGLIADEESAFFILNEIIQDCQKSGYIRNGDVRNLATSAWLMVHGIATLLLGNQVMLRNLSSHRAEALTREMIQNLYVGLK